MQTKKFIFVERSDGTVVDIPESDARSTLLRHPDWKVLREEQGVDRNITVEPPNELARTATVTDDTPANQCPICYKVFKNAGGLTGHKRSHGKEY